MADQEVDKKVSKQMFSLIELLTTSGKPNLNPEIMKKFKKICRTSDAHITHAHELLLMQLTKNHSEIRLSTFQMMDELFNRSHAFRLLILQDFHTLLELTVGTDTSLPIPPPKAAAKAMKNEACRSIQQWYDKFKEGYPKLVLGYEFLKTTKKVDFDEIQAQAEHERQIKEETARKMEQARKDKLDKVVREIGDGKIDIELVVTEVENGLELLMPHPDNFFIGSTSPNSSEIDKNSSLPSSQSSQNKNENCPLPSSISTDGKDNQFSGVLQTLTDITDIDEPMDTNQENCLNNSSKAVNMSDSSTEKLNNQSQPKMNVNEVSNESCANGTLKISTTDTQNSAHDDEHLSNGTNEEKGNNNASDRNNPNENDKEKDGDDDNEEEEDEGEEETYEAYSEEMRGGVFTKEHGRLSHTVEITIDMGSDERGLKVTDDNADIVQDVREKYKLIKSKYLNYVKRWLQVMTDCKAKTDEIKVMEALKSRLEDAVKKCLELDIISSAAAASTSKRAADSDSEDDFEDVPEKDGYEDDIPEHIKLEAFSKASTSKSGKGRSKPKQKKQYWMLPEDDNEDGDDPTTIHKKFMAENSKYTKSSSSVSKPKPGTSKMSSIAGPSTSGSSKSASSSIKSSTKSSSESSSESAERKKNLVQGASKEELLEKAPVKSFGLDLEHWGNPEKIEAPLQVKYEGASRFWVPEKEAEESATQDQVAALTTRTITYAGEFEPVKWTCRAPLPDGLLCERMDRKKCPFHGKIIPRDELGQPTDPEDIERIIKQDLKEEDEASSPSPKGKSPVKGKGKEKAKKRKYPNLTDTTVTKTCRERLESKIFKKSTLSKVNKVLDAIDVKKATDKFANQFNYSLK